MGVVPPAPDFLSGLRDITKKNGALLIIDEVITGFRLHNGAAQQLLNVEADLTTLGKIIGGGLPVAAYGGRAEFMNNVAPPCPRYQPRTLTIRCSLRPGSPHRRRHRSNRCRRFRFPKSCDSRRAVVGTDFSPSHRCLLPKKKCHPEGPAHSSRAEGPQLRASAQSKCVHRIG